MSALEQAQHYDRLYSGRPVNLHDYGSRSTRPRSLAAPYRESEELIASLIARGSRVLDFGCGVGRYTVFPALAGATTIGLDVSPISAAVAARRRDAVAPGSALGFIAGDGHALPFADGAFDLITSYGVLSCVDLDRCLVELRRVLRPGSSIVVVDTLQGIPLLRWRRKRHARAGRETQQTVDNILTLADIERMRRTFDHVEIVSVHRLTTLISASLRRFPRLAEIVDVPLRALDAALFRLPFMRRWAWKVVLHLRVE